MEGPRPPAQRGSARSGWRDAWIGPSPSLPARVRRGCRTACPRPARLRVLQERRVDVASHGEGRIERRLRVGAERPAAVRASVRLHRKREQRTNVSVREQQDGPPMDERRSTVIQGVSVEPTVAREWRPPCRPQVPRFRCERTTWDPVSNRGLESRRPRPPRSAGQQSRSHANWSSSAASESCRRGARRAQSGRSDGCALALDECAVVKDGRSMRRTSFVDGDQ